jgi:hypothetical protein
MFQRVATIKCNLNNSQRILLCQNCRYHNKVNDKCQIFKDTNVLLARTRKDMCGPNARYYEFLNNIETHTPIYAQDGATYVITNKNREEHYYNQLHNDFKDIY